MIDTLDGDAEVDGIGDCMQHAEEIFLLIVDLLTSLRRLCLSHPLPNVLAELEKGSSMEVSSQESYLATVEELVGKSDVVEYLLAVSL